MEYAEDEEPDQTMEESKLEAHANIPNIPVPRSSDDSVSPRRYLAVVCMDRSYLAVSALALGNTYAKFYQGRLEAIPP